MLAVSCSEHPLPLSVFEQRRKPSKPSKRSEKSCLGSNQTRESLDLWRETASPWALPQTSGARLSSIQPAELRAGERDLGVIQAEQPQMVCSCGGPGSVLGRLPVRPRRGEEDAQKRGQESSALASIVPGTRRRDPGTILAASRSPALPAQCFPDLVCCFVFF